MLGSRDVAPCIFPSHLGIIQVLTLIYKDLPTAVSLTATFARAHHAAATLLWRYRAVLAEPGWTSFCLKAFAPLSLPFSNQTTHLPDHLHNRLIPHLIQVCAQMSLHLSLPSHSISFHITYLGHICLFIYFLLSLPAPAGFL